MKVFKILFFLAVLISGITACQPDDDFGAFTPENEEISLDPAQAEVSKVAGQYSFMVTSNLPWRAKSNAAWITVTTQQGSTSGAIEYSVAANPTTEQRSGTIEVWITQNSKVLFTVIQEAGDLPPDTAQNIYVKPNGTGDGSSWDNATTLSQALKLNLFDGDKIHVSAGTHTPLYTFGGEEASDATERTFDLNRNIEIIGGYSANPSPDELPSPSVNETVLSGQLSGSQTNHVIAVTAALVSGHSVKISGVTIKDGYANGSGNSVINGVSFPKNYAGGIIIAGGILELNNCIVSSNKASSHGVGIYAFSGAELIINNSKIIGNQGATSNGCGLYLNGASATITGTTIENNITNGVGAGIQTFVSAILKMYNCTIANNSAGSRAGALYARNNTQAILVNCTLYGNTTTTTPGNGGAIHTHDSSTITIISSTITANQGGTGGGINNTEGCTINLYNSIVSGNLQEGNPSDIIGDVSYEYCITGSNTYGDNGAPLAGEVFDSGFMLSALSNNGGTTQTCALAGSNNPAVNNGMPVTELQALGSTLSPGAEASIITNDQAGNSRAGSQDIGALVQQ